MICAVVLSSVLLYCLDGCAVVRAYVCMIVCIHMHDCMHGTVPSIPESIACRYVHTCMHLSVCTARDVGRLAEARPGCRLGFSGCRVCSNCRPLRKVNAKIRTL